MKPWDIEGKWSVSHFGWAEDVRKEMPLLPKKVLIRDVTFREGDDCVGYRVSVEDKLAGSDLRAREPLPVIAVAHADSDPRLCPERAGRCQCKDDSAPCHGRH